jgi:hypothetical protein
MPEQTEQGSRRKVLVGENETVIRVTGRPDVLKRIKDAGRPGTSLPKPFALTMLVRPLRELRHT